jgi:hypothetical protein
MKHSQLVSSRDVLIDISFLGLTPVSRGRSAPHRRQPLVHAARCHPQRADRKSQWGRV